MSSQDVGILDLASGSNASGENGVRCTVHKHPDSKSQAADLRKEGSRGELRSKRLAPASSLACAQGSFPNGCSGLCVGEGTLLVLASGIKAESQS